MTTIIAKTYHMHDADDKTYDAYFFGAPHNFLVILSSDKENKKAMHDLFLTEHPHNEIKTVSGKIVKLDLNNVTVPLQWMKKCKKLCLGDDFILTYDDPLQEAIHKHITDTGIKLEKQTDESFEDFFKKFESEFGNKIQESAKLKEHIGKFKIAMKDITVSNGEHDVAKYYETLQKSIVDEWATNPAFISDDRKYHELFDEGYKLLMDGKYEESLEKFILCLDNERHKNVSMYNIACCHSLLGNKESALSFLNKSIDTGYTNFIHTIKDKDFEFVKNDKGFADLIKKMIEKSEDKQANESNDSFEVYTFLQENDFLHLIENTQSNENSEDETNEIEI